MMDKEISLSSDSSLEDSQLLSPTSNESTFSSECDDEPAKYCCSRSESATNLRAIILTIIVTLLTTAALQQLYHKITFSRDATVKSAIATLYSEQARLSPRHHCGNSSTEAQAQGCFFDLSVSGWIPAACHDAELAQRFLDFGLRIYVDKEGTREVTLEHLAASAGTDELFWVPHGFHIVHCELAWERMHRSLRDGRMRLTTHLLNFDHTRHCAKYQEYRTPLEEINVQLTPILNTC